MVLNLFYRHLHEDEEIRFILDGSGYFDVRDKNEEWIRLAVEKGDMIVLVRIFSLRKIPKKIVLARKGFNLGTTPKEKKVWK